MPMFTYPVPMPSIVKHKIYRTDSSKINHPMIENCSVPQRRKKNDEKEEEIIRNKYENNKKKGEWGNFHRKWYASPRPPIHRQKMMENVKSKIVSSAQRK